MEALTFDTWALLSFVFNETEAASMEKLLREVRKRKIKGYFSVVNLAEFYRRISVEESEDSAIEKSAWLTETGIEIVSPGIGTALKAGSLKNRHPNLSYGDTFAVSLALESDSKLVTGDPDFKVPDIDAKSPTEALEELSFV